MRPSCKSASMLCMGPLALLLASCSSLGGAGPSKSAIRAAGDPALGAEGIVIVELDRSVIARMALHDRSSNFASVFGDVQPTLTMIGNGDMVDVAIWEAPPAVLFGTAMAGPRGSDTVSVGQSVVIPEQMVGDDGAITVPFIGQVEVANRNTAQVEREILNRLRGRAHDPQVIVRLIQNEARNVTVMGEVASSRRVPLSAQGQRVLDAVANAGGPTRPVDKTTIQLARGAEAVVMPLEEVVRDPAQNIRLQPGDVVTLFHQPFSFTALGAVSQNTEISFEGVGLTLAEALGRVGGLRDDRADIRGVFVFRMEDPEHLGISPNSAAAADELGIPVIYRLDLSEPASIFLARQFEIQDDDILYVSTAPGADLQRFISTLSNSAFSIIGLSNAVR